jgi:hypothetical protein
MAKLQITGPFAAIVSAVGGVIQAGLKHDGIRRQTMDDKLLAEFDRLDLRLRTDFLLLVRQPGVEAGLLPEWKEDQS